jgi:hypothetical protein
MQRGAMITSQTRKAIAIHSIFSEGFDRRSQILIGIFRDQTDIRSEREI